MITFRIISFGKSKHDFILEGESEYISRLKGTAKIEPINIAVPGRKNSSEEDLKTLEAKALLKKIRATDHLIVLDESGKSFTSKNFANYIERTTTQGTSTFTFAIGGPYGWDEEIKKRAKLLLSLSPMTFTSQFARLVLVEQVYRAMTIIKGLPYHKS